MTPNYPRACTIAIIHACILAIVHACIKAIVHAWTIAILHACIIAIVHACTLAKVHVSCPIVLMCPCLRGGGGQGAKPPRVAGGFGRAQAPQSGMIMIVSRF